MKKRKVKDVSKSTNRWVKFIALSGITLTVLGAAGFAVGMIKKNVEVKEKEKVYSVTWDLTKDTTKGKRGDDAVGMVAGINGEKNDFDSAYPWKSIKRVTDENGDVFTRIPKYYEKFEVSESKFTYSISPSARKGFHVAPAFVQGEDEIPYIDIGSYEASIDKQGHLRSVSGVMPEVTGHTLDQYRSLAEAGGNQLFDWRGNQALQGLFLVEFANLDSQAIMTGETQYLAYVHELTEEEIAAKKLKTFTVDMDEACIIDQESDHVKMFKVNNDAGHIEVNLDHYADEEVEGDEDFQIIKNVKVASYELNSAEDEIEEVTLKDAIDVSRMAEGETLYLTVGSYNYHKTGSSDGRKGSSNGASLKSLEIISMNYRGVENWYGNTYTWCDGLATYMDDQDQKYICVSLDAKLNGDRSTYEKYAVEDASDSMFLGNGLFFNNFSVTDTVEYQYDYFSFSFASEQYRIGRVGGDYGNNAYAGAFYVSVDGGVSVADGSVRLSCIPQAQ